MPGTGTGADGSDAFWTNGDLVDGLDRWADANRGDGALRNCCGNGKADPRLGVGGSEGDDKDEDGTDGDGEVGDGRSAICEVCGGGGKAVEIASGMEWP